MAEYIERQAVLSEYDRQHKGPPGGARRIIETFPAADVRPAVRGKWEKVGEQMLINLDNARGAVCRAWLSSSENSKSAVFVVPQGDDGRQQHCV